jgi:heat shock protein 4
METDNNKPQEATGEKTDAGANEKKKKKVRYVDLPFSGQNLGLSLKDIQDLTQEEAQMAASDRLAVETADRKNAVEAYVYDMRNKINETLSAFATEADKEAFEKLLNATEDWLYGEGEDATKSVYVKKLEELQALGNPIVKRRWYVSQKQVFY